MLTRSRGPVQQGSPEPAHPTRTRHHGSEGHSTGGPEHEQQEARSGSTPHLRPPPPQGSGGGQDAARGSFSPVRGALDLELQGAARGQQHTTADLSAAAGVHAQHEGITAPHPAAARGGGQQ